MDFYDIVRQVLELLQRDGRTSYRALKRQFNLDDDTLADLKEELLYAHPVIDDEGRGLVWTDTVAQVSPLPTGQPEPLYTNQDHEPLSYTPRHLAEKILASRNVLEGERKQVTVMFADIKDSTELIRDLDPEAAQKLLDPAIHIMMNAVHRFEGTVNQVLGDGIMAIYGAPIAHEDHALRACYAALAMQAAMHPYAEEVRSTHGIEMQIRVGLNSGEVVVRTIGNDLHMDYSAVGPTTHLAARMEQLARPGSIRFSASTHRLVEGFVQLNALGEVPVKGMTEPVEVFELTGASPVKRRLQVAVARGLTRFVGRDTEIESLNQALEQAGEGHGQVVAVIGEAGVGKSRLFFEFIHSHRTQGWLILESSSVSYGKATSYLPITDLLKAYFQIEAHDTTQHIREKVTGKLLTLDEQLKDAIPPIFFLLEALPVDAPLRSLEPPYRRSLILDALKRLMMRESQRQPLLLVFEDLHWLDAESQTALDMLVESLPTSRVLLLTNYRPEYDDHWTSKTYYTRLRVDPLLPQDTDAILTSLLGDHRSVEALKALLKARTEGNPLFLEESVRTLVETQALVGQPGAYGLQQDIHSVQIPPTVQALLAARIDRLASEEKQLLQSAAVIGNDVPFPLLQAIVDLPEDDLRRGLAHLQEAEFVYETRLFPDAEYTFKHALIHDVAYASLLHEHRRQLHRRVGQAIEARYPDRLAEFAEMLANQFEHGEDWVKAVHYYLNAGEKMKERYAYQGAIGFCTRALDLATDGSIFAGERLRGLVLLGDLWSLLGDLEQANQSYEGALSGVTDTTTQGIIVNRRHQPHCVVRHGSKIVFYEHGSGDHTLILAHPLIYGLAFFQPLVEKFCQEFRIITIDPRGTGASDPLPERYALKDHMEDVRAVIEAASAGSPVVCIGVSRGGTLMTMLAAAYPSLIHQLILVSTHAAPSMTYAQAGWVEEVRDLIRQGKKEQALRIMATVNYPEPGTDHLVEQSVRMRLDIPSDMLLKFLDPDPEDDIVSLLPHIRVPTLVMHGTADRRVPFTAGQYLAEQIPGAQLYAFQGKGHMAMVTTAMNEFCEVLRYFVRTGGVPQPELSGP